jgi:hypothetical protein
MHPKGKGIMINDKEKETLYVDEPKGDKPTNSGSNNKRIKGQFGAARPAPRHA